MVSSEAAMGGFECCGFGIVLGGKSSVDEPIHLYTSSHTNIQT
jgi:hypothetical protein